MLAVMNKGGPKLERGKLCVPSFIPLTESPHQVNREYIRFFLRVHPITEQPITNAIPANL